MAYAPHAYYKRGVMRVARTALEATALAAKGFKLGEALDLNTGQIASPAPDSQATDTEMSVALAAERAAQNATYVARAAGSTLVAEPLPFVNVQDFGAMGNGSADDTAAINAAIAALASTTYGGTIWFPEGNYQTNGGHILPAGPSIHLRGSGPYTTVINRRNGASGDLLTISSTHSGVSQFSIHGNASGAPASSDGVVLNAAYAYVDNCYIKDNRANGITVGKASGAILYRLTRLLLRTNRGYGVHVVAASGSSDGEWSNVDIGMSGLAGVRLSTGAQQLVNVHVWQSGLEAASPSDKAGFWLNSPNNMLSNCESETNIGAGVQINSAGADGNGIVNSDIWGNVAQGIFSFGGTKFTTLVGNRLRDNAVSNTAGSSSSYLSQITNEDGVEWVVVGNACYDTGSAIPAGSYGTYVPANPFPGRAAGVFTVAHHYAEVAVGATPDRSSFVGNVWPAARTRTGLENVYVGKNHQHSERQGVVKKASGSATVIPHATAGTYGAAVSVLPPTGASALFLQRLAVQGAGTFGAETLSIRVRGVYADGITVDLVKTFASATFTEFTTSDLYALALDGRRLVEVQIAASSTLAASGARGSYFLSGIGV